MGTWARRGGPLAAAWLVVAGLAALPVEHAEAAAATQPVTIRIMSVECASACDGTGIESAGMGPPDFYGVLSIGSQSMTTPVVPDKAQVFAPQGWTLTADVPTSLPEVELVVQIKDEDPGVDPNGDDVADISARSGDTSARIKLNLVNGKLSGDLTDPTGCTRGGGDGHPVQVCYDIRPYSFEDGDGDSFTDYAEYRGLDFDNDGTIDLHLEQWADPRRRDLFVEIDWMTGFAPQNGVLPAVEQVFARAPVTNPTTRQQGLALHLIPDEEVPYSEALRLENDRDPNVTDFDDLKWGSPDLTCAHGGEDGHFGTSADRSSPLCEQILLFKRLHFRYGIFANGLYPPTVPGPNNTPVPNTSSGRAELDDRGANLFTVTLGRLAAQMNLADFGGRAATEEATLLHELGHTFGLGHGGRTDNGRVDLINCKPNYLSVMNYPLQFATAASLPARQQLDPNRPLDYQRLDNVQTLNEAALDETALPGVAGAGSRLIIWGGNGANLWFHDPANGQLNWKVDLLPSGGPRLERSVAVDLNHLTMFTGCDQPTPGQQLVSRPDWDRLVYDFSSSPLFSDGVHGTPPDEIDAVDLRRLTAADLNVTKTVDKSDALPGDELTYTITAGNAGPGAATAVSVTDTPPTGQDVTRTLPDLPADGHAEQKVTYTVPCAVTDGQVLTNRVKVTGKDAAGQSEPDWMLTDNSATADTTAHTPRLSLAVEGTPSAGAGETLTYTVTYRNTGSAPATGVVLTLEAPDGVSPRTLRQEVGTVAAGASGTARFAVRTSLLTAGGSAVTVGASAAYGGAGGCAYPAANATATSTVTEQPPGRNPQISALWLLRTGSLPAELLARVQATDTRFDGADGSAADGVLTPAEVRRVLLNPVTPLRAELLTVYLNLGERRVNASTRVESLIATKLGTATVAAAARHAQATLALPGTPANLPAYATAETLLTSINLNLSPRY
ncbi:hypothetical protein DMB42_42385 [Nonomuraea sp. WAC 01424]|uniref:NEW3 domain-containing protein n=1 Tax=Nonomuraea sp. WAC 01424 TaxID=2203200 RepID=UPI000F77CD7B|nr:NEW3 domain-containing protein [Nonomuraea sp. WAC 01424]RSM99548.1 hypothetical protein DMB42_42385 [Nonomuraea sp. WAC 01424]